jgi:hypothetical protein
MLTTKKSWKSRVPTGRSRFIQGITRDSGDVQLISSARVVIFRTHRFLYRLTGVSRQRIRHGNKDQSHCHEEDTGENGKQSGGNSRLRFHLGHPLLMEYRQRSPSVINRSLTTAANPATQA